MKNYLHEYSINKGEITYAEFFDTSLFEEIKKDIGYNGEKVVAFGFHPSVLIYNGFTTIDGYSS